MGAKNSSFLDNVADSVEEHGTAVKVTPAFLKTLQCMHGYQHALSGSVLFLDHRDHESKSKYGREWTRVDTEDAIEVIRDTPGTQVKQFHLDTDEQKVYLVDFPEDESESESESEEEEVEVDYESESSHDEEKVTKKVTKTMSERMGGLSRRQRLYLVAEGLA